jgi:hypothetical protein
VIRVRLNVMGSLNQFDSTQSYVADDALLPVGRVKVRVNIFEVSSKLTFVCLIFLQTHS